jgi:fatty-acyl-CoA synthase
VDAVEGYVIITENTLDDVETVLSPLFNYEKMLDKKPPHYDWPMINEKSAFSACYTTGTTGKPKGVYYSHRCIYLHTMAAAMTNSFTLQDVIMQTTPMFHASGWGTWLCAPMVGAKLVLAGRVSLEAPQALVDLMVNEKVTYNNGAPAIFIPLLDYIRSLPEKPKFANLRMGSGATEPPLSMMRGYAGLGVNIVHSYGATETTPLAVFNHLKPTIKGWSKEQQWENQKKQGLPVTGVEAKIVGEDGKEVPNDGKTVGELYLRGPWITSSYYNDSRNDECFIDGYWKSGDVATIDKYGYIKITDRSKDAIKSGGEWISTIDLENAIVAHPDVLEAAVIGLIHPKWQERPLALVVLKKGAEEKIAKEDILAFIESRFAKWQLPDKVLFVNQIAKTSVGKLDKKFLRKKYENIYMQNVDINH